jgi:hypothetical protein
MRNLTRTQKKLLTAEIKKYVQENGITPVMYVDLDWDVLETIDALNPCEIFYQNVDRFISDYDFKERQTRSWEHGI